MKEAIYEYIKEHGAVTIAQISIDLDIQGVKAARAVEELRKDCYVRLVSPVPLNVSQGNSCYYEVTNKKYVIETER